MNSEKTAVRDRTRAFPALRDDLPDDLAQDKLKWRNIIHVADFNTVGTKP